MSQRRNVSHCSHERRRFLMRVFGRVCWVGLRDGMRPWRDCMSGNKFLLLNAGVLWQRSQWLPFQYGRVQLPRFKTKTKHLFLQHLPRFILFIILSALPDVSTRFELCHVIAETSDIRCYVTVRGVNGDNFRSSCPAGTSLAVIESAEEFRDAYNFLLCSYITNKK